MMILLMILVGSGTVSAITCSIFMSQMISANNRALEQYLTEAKRLDKEFLDKNKKTFRS